MSKAPSVVWEIQDPIRLHGERRRAEITARVLELKHGDIILDVGCGDGYQISYILGCASKIVGMDISHAGLKKAKERVKGVDFICASSEKVPFQHQIFDKVMCLELLEHLENPSKTLKEIEFVLKGDGTLIISVPYRERIISTQCVHCGNPTPLWGHLHSFDEKKLSSLLPESLKVLHRIYIGTVMAAYPLFSLLPTSLWKLVDDVSRVLPGMKPSWFISKIKKS